MVYFINKILYSIPAVDWPREETRKKSTSVVVYYDYYYDTCLLGMRQPWTGCASYSKTFIARPADSNMIHTAPVSIGEWKTLYLLCGNGRSDSYGA